MKKLLIIILALVFLTPNAFAAWVYTQTFDLLNDGDLNAQDIWTANIAYDVQGTIKQGASGKSVELVTASVDATAALADDVTDEGRFQFYLASDAENDAGYLALREDSTYGTLAGLGVEVNLKVQARDGASWVNVGDFVADKTFVKIEIDFDIGDDTYEVEVDDGGDSTTLSFVSTLTKVNQILIQNHTEGTFYFDTFANAAPVAAVVTPPPPVPQPVLLITKIKRFFFPNAEAAAILKWLNPEYRILRYVWKVRRYGLTTTHVKTMVESGDDYTVLKEALGKPTVERNLVNRRLNDGKIDYDRLKASLVGKGLMTNKEFDDAVASLRSNGLIDATTMEIDNDGILVFEEFENAKSWLEDTSNATSTPLGGKGVVTSTNTLVYGGLGALLLVLLAWGGSVFIKRK